MMPLIFLSVATKRSAMAAATVLLPSAASASGSADMNGGNSMEQQTTSSNCNPNPGSPMGAKHYESKTALWQDLSDCVPNAREGGLGNLIEELKQKGHIILSADLTPACIRRLSCLQFPKYKKPHPFPSLSSAGAFALYRTMHFDTG
jgi:hypothetical protein